MNLTMDVSFTSTLDTQEYTSLDGTMYDFGASYDNIVAMLY
jgi:hypothetical protein